MNTVASALKGTGIWVGLFALAAGLMVGLRLPAAQGWLPIAIGVVAFVGCLAGRAALVRHSARETKASSSGAVRA